MNNIIFYNSHNIFCNPNTRLQLQNIPGGVNFSCMFDVFSKNISLLDRTQTITGPLKLDILPWLEMPKYEKFSESFSNLIDQRALQLFNQAVNSNKKLAVMYSGGIDSTAILVALLKNIKQQDIDNHVVVLLSELSISENPNFYRDHVVKKFNCISSFRFPYLIGNDDYLFVSGENADQLFGSQVTGYFSRGRDFKDVFKPIDQLQGEIIQWMQNRINSDKKDQGEKIFYLLKRIVDRAPITLDTTYKFFWWINFATKWQSVYVRMLGFSNNISNIKLEENYTTFYHPKEFQLWSMNNADILIKDTGTSSKYIVKEYIFNYNKDSEYLNRKSKVESLSFLCKSKSIPVYIDRDMKPCYEYPNETLYNLKNDFI